MIKFILWVLTAIAILDIAFIVVMLNYSKRKGEW